MRETLVYHRLVNRLLDPFAASEALSASPLSKFEEGAISTYRRTAMEF
jgi:hypothetical protein